MLQFVRAMIENWMARQVKSAVQEVFSPVVMKRTVEALRKEFKDELTTYRRQKETEMGVLIDKHTKLMASFGKISDIVNGLKFKNAVLMKTLAICAPPKPGEAMTEQELRALIESIEIESGDELRQVIAGETEREVDVNTELMELLGGGGERRGE